MKNEIMAEILIKLDFLLNAARNSLDPAAAQVASKNLAAQLKMWCEDAHIEIEDVFKAAKKAKIL